MSQFLDDAVTFAVGEIDAKRIIARQTKESYSPANSFNVLMKVRERFPARTDLRSRSIASILGRLASDPRSPIVRIGQGWRDENHYALVEGSFVLKLEGCARCRGEGHNLVFIPLDYPIKQLATKNRISVGTHWAMCPTTHQPIIFGQASS